MQLISPTPDEAVAGLRAMRALADAGAPLGPAATAMIAAAQRNLLTFGIPAPAAGYPAAD